MKILVTSLAIVVAAGLLWYGYAQPNTVPGLNFYGTSTESAFITATTSGADFSKGVNNRLTNMKHLVTIKPPWARLSLRLMMLMRQTL